MGLIPIVISAVKVEKYYTSFYIGLWNLYGTIMVILGYIIDFDVSIGLIVFGVISIIVIIVVILISYLNNFPKLIRYAGKSIFSVTLAVFYSALFFCQEYVITTSFAIFTLVLFFLITKVFQMRDLEKLILIKSKKEDRYPHMRDIKLILSYENLYEFLKNLLNFNNIYFFV